MDGIVAPGIPFTIIMFLVVLGVLVFVHELGHYAAARLLGIRVETFSVGFGRELVGFTDRHGTRWKVGWIPLGGYAKFVGDLDAASRPDPATFALPEAEKRALFAFRPVWQRALVVAAGPAVNFLFAILLFAGFFMTWGHQYTPPVVGEVVPGSPAAAAGLAPGDRLVAVGGRPVDRFEDVVRLVAVSAGRPLELEVERAGRRLVLEALPAAETEIDRFGNRHVKGRLGIRSGPPVVERRGPVEAVVHAVDETVEITRLMGEVLVQVVTGRRPLDELGGPLRIAKASGESAAMGLAAFVTFVALISINLGFANLLPVPMLDGGHLLLYAVEAIRRRPLEPRLQEIAFMMGFVFLVSLMFLLTVNDLASFGLWRDPASPQG